MATYNGAEYLKAQLESFAGQTRLPNELIITDDCSIDETEAIVREFENEVSFKVSFHRNQKRLGFCGNFNEALMRSTGDIVFLSDQDDVWYPEKIEYMVGVAERHPDALVVMNDAQLTDESLNGVGLTKIGQIKSAGLPMDSFVMGCCCGFRREFLDLCLPIPLGLKAHDNWLVEVAASLGGKTVEDKVLQYYRRHENNESQFIANRLTKVRPIHVFISSLTRFLKNDVSTQDQLYQRHVFVSAIQEVIDKSPNEYGERLSELKMRALQEIDLIERRLKIREQSLVPRLVAALRLVFSGGYHNSNGLKSVLRDILG